MSDSDLVTVQVLDDAGALVSFAQTEGGNTGQRDIILPGFVELTRGDVRALFNISLDADATVPGAPSDTEWAFAGLAGNPEDLDPTAAETLLYLPFAAALDGRVGSNVVGRDGILHIISADLYFPVVFDAWGQSGAGGFAYSRTLVPLDIGPDPAFAEADLGDFSDDPAVPTDIGALSLGETTLTAAQAGDPRDVDFVTFEVPEGAVLAGLTLAGYDAAAGNRAFLGLAEGAATALDPLAPDAGLLLGGVVYGADDTGTDLLPAIAALEGAVGTDLPLGPGSYTLWFNQTGPASEVTLSLDLRPEGTGQGLSEADAQAVALLYEAGLDRNGNIDLGGLNFWIDQREAGLSETQLAQAFLDSGEFEAAFGAPETLSDQELVEQLFRNVLNREGEQAGVDFWVGALERPAFTRANLLEAFAASPENIDGSPFVDALAEIAEGDWAFV